MSFQGSFCPSSMAGICRVPSTSGSVRTARGEENPSRVFNLSRLSNPPSGGDFIHTYNRNRNEASDVALESSPVAYPSREPIFRG